MKKAAIVLTAKLCLASHLAFGIAASQEWVTNYVEEVVTNSRSEAILDVSESEADNVIAIAYRDAVLRYERPSDAALLVTNCTAQAGALGMTNGCLFVWNGAGAYINSLGAISCTATNLVFEGVSSIATNGVERFTGWFDAYGVLIQPHTSFAITNGVTEVH